MSYTNYSQWRDTNLRRYWITVDGCRVAYWASELQTIRPTLLFVHGITGDHNGLVPLAREFADTHNLLLLELPGHGETTGRKLKSAQMLQDWLKSAVREIEKSVSSIDSIIAHSFGCSAVMKITDKDIILLCPVPTPSRLYGEYARVIQRLAPFWAFFYSWKMFIWLRGVTIQKIYTREASRRIRWVGTQAKASYRQIIYQAQLVDIVLDATAFKSIPDRVKLVIAGLGDTTACERDTAELAEVFPSSPIEILRGGHLLPIETPERVAACIRRHVY